MTAPWIRDDGSPWIIAEVGVNHNGSEALALRLIHEAAVAGADVVKFQTYRAELVATARARSAPYQERRTKLDSQVEMLRAFELSEDAWRNLAAATRAAGLGFMSTAFDEASLGLVESLDPVAHKVPSGEVTHLRLVRAVGACRRPVVVSTGMADVDEIGAAVIALVESPHIALLHCVTAYPAPIEQSNLLSIPFLQERFGLGVGWSDHTEGPIAGIAAVALGATIVERHLTLDRTMNGPDHAASDEPHDFARYVKDLRSSWSSLGEVDKTRAYAEEQNVTAARRGWYAATDLVPGVVVAEGHVVALRPEGELRADVPVVGRRMVRGVRRGDPLTPDDLEALP